MTLIYSKVILLAFELAVLGKEEKGNELLHLEVRNRFGRYSVVSNATAETRKSGKTVMTRRTGRTARTTLTKGTAKLG